MKTQQQLLADWWSSKMSDEAFYQAMSATLLHPEGMTMVLQVKRAGGGGGWIDADTTRYDSTADWNRRIVYVPKPK